MIALIAFVVLSCVFYFFKVDVGLSDPSKVAGLGAALSSIAATMLGFMLAALSILATISGVDLLQAMYRSGHYKSLLKSLFFGCLAVLIFLLLSLWMLFGLPIHDWFSSIYLSVVAATFVVLIEIGFKFWMVLSNLSGEE